MKPDNKHEGAGGQGDRWGCGCLRRAGWGLLVAGALWGAPSAGAAEARLERVTGPEGAAHLRVSRDDDEDWQLEVSNDLVQWAVSPGFGVLVSGGTNAPTRAVPAVEGEAVFLRARRTAGLFDDTLLRTFSLTFTQANWAAQLTTARTTGSNIVGRLELDNGQVVERVGARYKGNTSFTGMGSTPVKKSINLETDAFDPEGHLLGYHTINLNNAYGDETILRETVYFNVMHRYAPSPKGALARLFINGANWGVYSLAQQEDKDLLDEWFPSNDGDRWRTPNIGGPGGGGGGGFGGAGSALSWLGTNVVSYRNNYELKTSDDPTNAWVRLVNAINVLNNTPAAELRDKVEDVLAVDRWLWFLAVENIFADDDSYWNKGADYGFYWEPESGRIHPLEHDGNEAFTAGDVSLSPVQGSTGTNRPVISRLLAVAELRQRYLAHLRTVLKQAFHPEILTPVINRLSALSIEAIRADPKKGYTAMSTYTNDLQALRSFVTNRYRFLTNHVELRPATPVISAVSTPAAPPAGSPARITATVQAGDQAGLDSVWLWYRAGSTGKFTRTAMADDGAHEDGAAGDGVYGGDTTGFVAGTRVRYYVEARGGNTAKAASFSPAEAEGAPLSYRVTTSAGTESPVVINELQADNGATLRDPQGDYDDWVELRNLSEEEVDLSGRYLSDNPDNPRKWAFPAGTRIAAGGYLLVWLDEDSTETPGLHANFRLSASGEQLLLVDTDAHLNALLDSVTFGPQTEDRAWGRPASNPTVFQDLAPTPGAANP